MGPSLFALAHPLLRIPVPKQTVLGDQKAGIGGVIGGFFEGVAMRVVRTVTGGFAMATFRAPVPQRFEPARKPAAVFEGR